MQIVYIDQLGRPVSPSMVPQYSPHQVPQSSFYHPPPNPDPSAATCGPLTPMMDHPPIHMPHNQDHGRIQGQGYARGQGQAQAQGGMPFPPNFWPVYTGGPPPHGPPHLPHLLQHGPPQPGPMFIVYPGPPPPIMNPPHMPIYNPGPPGVMSSPLMVSLLETIA